MTIVNCPVENSIYGNFESLKHQSKKCRPRSGSEVKKLFICSTQLSMKFFLLLNVKMPTIVGILTFMSMKNSILAGLSDLDKKLNFSIFSY